MASGATPKKLAARLWAKNAKGIFMAKAIKSAKATKKASSTKSKSSGQVKSDSGPKFPYTTKPASLRRLLKEIPKKPKPSKVDLNLLKAWGFNDTNDVTIIRVLKAMSLLSDKGEPTDLYGRYMSLESGAKALAPEIRRVYAPMFQASHTPYSESSEKLQNLFNIHSGGAERALEYQIQTFKALCENASFDSSIETTSPAAIPTMQDPSGMTNVAGVGVTNGATAVHINLHIHLPENKSRRDYEDIIEDIGRYIFGRTSGERRDR